MNLLKNTLPIPSTIISTEKQSVSGVICANGVSRDDIILKFQLGYCLDERDAFTKSAVNAGYNKDFLVKTGLTIEGKTTTLPTDSGAG